MTTFDALAGAAMVVLAVAGAREYRPKRDPKWMLALILTLATAGGWLTVGQIALEASRQVEAQAR